MFWLLYCYCFFITFLKCFAAPQLWNLYHQQRKGNSFLLVGGTVKELVKLESLRKPFENQILTPLDMYQWADENIENIKFFCVSTEDTASHASVIQNRLTVAEATDGTRSYHCFWPIGQTKLELCTLSADEIFVVKNLHESKKLFVDIDCLKIFHYVSAVYEGQWYPSLILEINWDQRGLLVKSMYNSGYDKNCFFWPPRDDIYHMPFIHIIQRTEYQTLLEDIDESVTKSVQNCLNYLTKT